MVEQQVEFIKREFWILAWNASVQRSRLYMDKTEEKQRLEFRENAIRVMGAAIFPLYESKVDESLHYENLQTISDRVSVIGGDLLSDAGYKIGVAQKAFNLILKYYWCAGLIAEPPHCPVDRIILGKTALKDSLNWTQIVSIEEYKRAVGHIRTVAHKAGLSIAQWELNTFNRRNG